MYIKRIPKLGDSLKSNLKKRHFWRGIEASQVAQIYLEIASDHKVFQGTQMVSWKNGVLKIKVPNAAQRQEIFFKQELLKEEMKKKEIEVKGIKIFL
ncbi:MAG: hypothetical protein V1690_02425 [Candidatus Moraniibacteriota bacterium]